MSAAVYRAQSAYRAAIALLLAAALYEAIARVEQRLGEAASSREFV